MQELWNPTIEDVIEAQELARSRGKGAGANYEEEFREVMQKKGKKPFGHTELNKDELLSDLAQKHGNILNMAVDSQGNVKYSVKKKEDIEKEK
jgi:hypothetical protein